MKPGIKYLILGVFFILGATFWILIAAVSSTRLNEYAGVAILSAVLASLLGTPAIWFLKKWRGEKRLAEELEKVALLLMSYGRISIPEAARRVGKSDVEMEALVLKALHRGMVRGFVDPDTHMFFYGMSAPVYQPVVLEPKVVQVPIQPLVPPAHLKGEKRFCRECGNTVYYLEDQGRWHCPKCGNYQA